MGRGKNSSEMPNNPEETRNFLIFLAVFIDIATETVLKVFYHEVPKHTFHSFVSTGNIDGILKKTLSKRQYYLVKFNTADPDRFDFSILFTLLRIALTPPSAGWNQKPAPTDVSVAADILRLRYLRNNIVAHRHKATLSTYDFNRYFGELEAVIFRLSGSEEQQHVAKKIESYKKVRLDYSKEEFYLNKLQEWHDDLQQKVQELLSETEKFHMFFEGKQDRYVQYLMLLVDAGRLVFIAYLQKLLAKQEESLAKLLLDKRELLQENLISQEMKTLCLDDNPNAHMESWDMSVLGSVILTVFGSSIKRKKRDAIKRIMKAWKNYASTATEVLDRDRFSHSGEDLVSSLRSLSGDDSEKIEELIERYRSPMEDVGDNVSYFEKLERHGVKIARIEDEYKGYVRSLKETISAMDDTGIFFKEKHGFALKFHLVCEDREKQKQAEGRLLKFLEDALKYTGRKLDSKEISGLQDILEHLENIPTVKLLNVKKSCIILIVRCQSKEGILALIDYIDGAIFHKHLTKVTDELEDIYEDIFSLKCHFTLESLHKSHPGSYQPKKDKGVVLSLQSSSPEEESTFKRSDVHGEEYKYGEETLFIARPDETLSEGTEEIISRREMRVPRIRHQYSLITTKERTFQRSDVNGEDYKYREETHFIAGPDKTLSEGTEKLDVVRTDDNLLGSNIKLQAEKERGISETCSDFTSGTLSSFTEETAAVGAFIDESESALSDESESAERESPIRKRKMKKDLKEDLIALYREEYHNLPLSPLIEEQDTPLLKFYVMPDINSVEIQRSLGGGNEIKSEVTSLRDVFYKKNKKCRKIYLTADAGLGKTAFSKRLVLTWCQAKMGIKSEQHFFKEEDIQAMSEFEFVFLLSLRDCSEECDIDEMIVKQVIPRLAHASVTVRDIETIISKGKGLVILDGLDEWIHPETTCKLGPRDIPHRKARECTILTTTRPWKLSVISLSSSQIDQKLELVGLNEESAYELKKNVISLLCEKPQITDEHIDKFDSAVEDKGISDLETIPLLLMYLLCLWCDEIDLGRSKCVLYCQIVELLLKRTFKKYPALQQAREPPRSDIPQFFSELVHCKNYYTLLQPLGQLAFGTLFSEKHESTLAFSPLVTKKYLNTEDMKLCLESGILTQSKEVKLISQSSKVSFSHKTVQEYFCALHISCLNESEVQNLVQQKFSSVQNILDMSTVFIFISGMNAEIMSSISRELMSVISEDKITRTDRSMASYHYRYANPLIDIQNMYISCLKENTDNTSLCFQDFIIDRKCQQENHFLNLKQLLIHNKSNIMSLSIQIEGIRCLRELIDQCELDDLHSVKKILYLGECKGTEIIRLLTNKSLECVTVLSCTFQGNKFIAKLSSCSSELSKTFQNISQLRAIHIDCFKMEHDVLKEFLNYIINRKSMAEIRLYNLHCVTHDISCGEMNLDFSQHSDLRMLGLSNIPVSQLKVNVSSLEDCNVGHLSKPGLSTSLLRELPAASKLHTFNCSNLKSSGDIETLLQTLPLLVQVKEVQLVDINLGERSLSLTPEMVNIELVNLDEVTMSGSSLRNLVKVVEKLPHSVTLEMWDCNITPETEFADVKKYIKTSENFVVTFDGIYQYGMYVFEFQTTEAGSRVH